MRRLRVLSASIFALAVLLLLLGAAPAAATFHLMQIREVYPGSAATPEAEYVELQMWASGQNLVEGHVLRSYDATGNVSGTSTFTHDVSSAVNQSTLLLATPQAEAQFGTTADAALVTAGLSPAGGAVCWETIDCVSWGSFSGTLPSPAGPPAAPGGILDGSALRRSITRGCATLLDPADDNDLSGEDFAVASPLPRPNSVPPTEQACTSGGGNATPGGGGGSGGGAAGGGNGPRVLDTFLRRKPPHRTRNRTPSFRFTASDDGARFECKLDRKPYRSCRSPFTTSPLRPGKHRFFVRARNGAEVDASPVFWRFRVLPVR
jgi:hypothetical protein